MNPYRLRIAHLPLLVLMLIPGIAGLGLAQPPFYRIGAPYPPVRDPNLTTDNGIPGTGSYYYRDYPWPSLREALHEYGLFGRRFQARAAANGTSAAHSAPAVLQVHLPEHAELWIGGSVTTQRGIWRRFVTPPLPAGPSFEYEVEARWIERGHEVRRTRSVRVPSGAETVVDFLRSEEESSTLPPPRPLSAR